MMSSIKALIKNSRKVLGEPTIVTGVIFILLIIAGFRLRYWYEQQLIREKRADARVELALQGNGLSGALERRLNLVEGLQTFLITEQAINDFPYKFETFAAGLFASTDGVLSIALAPGGKIQYIYPPESTGLLSDENLITDAPDHILDVIQHVIISQRVILSGPTTHPDGINSISAYLALHDQNDQFWGIGVVQYELGAILNQAGFILDSENIDVVIVDQDENLIYGNSDVLLKDPVTYQVYLQEGYWNLASAPKAGWEDTVKDPTFLFSTLEFLVICLVSAIAYLTTSSQSRLRRAILLSTQEIREMNLLLEERVAERTNELQTLLEVSRDVASTLDINAVLSLIFDHLKNVIGYSTLTLATAIDDEHLHVLKYQRLHDVNGLIASNEVKIDIVDKDLTNLPEPVVTPDVRQGIPKILEGLVSNKVEHEGKQPETFSWMVVPLIFKNKTTGLLFFEYKEPNYYSSKDAELALTFAYQAAVAVENARLYEQAQELAAVEERQKLARELHDSVSQALYGISLGTHTAKLTLDRDDSTREQLDQTLDYMLSLAKAGLADMRALIFELRPESLEQEGLVGAISKQIEVLEARYNIRVDKDIAEPDIPLDAKHAVYRLAQEAFNNIVKHAKASEVFVTLRKFDKDFIILEIQDNGVGFDPSVSYPDHFGLQSMRDRAQRIGGELQIESSANKGTLIRVKITTNT